MFQPKGQVHRWRLGWGQGFGSQLDLSGSLTFWLWMSLVTFPPGRGRATQADAAMRGGTQGATLATLLFLWLWTWFSQGP